MPVTDSDRRVRRVYEKRWFGVESDPPGNSWRETALELIRTARGRDTEIYAL